MKVCIQKSDKYSQVHDVKKGDTFIFNNIVYIKTTKSYGVNLSTGNESYFNDNAICVPKKFMAVPCED